MSNTGIPVNSGLVFDAVLYKGDNSRVISGSNYLDNNAVMANSPGMVLLDTKSIGTGVLVGDMVMTIMWDSTGTTDFDIIVQISKDGSSNKEILLRHEDATNDFGTTIVNKFDPKSNYRVIITALTTSEIILDYIRFTPVFPGSMVSATRRVADNEELIEVVDRGYFNVVGTGGATQAVLFSFNTAFDTIPTLTVSSYHHKLHSSIDVVDYHQAQVTLNHVDNVGWTGTYRVDWIAIGGKRVPFAPAMPV